jgi:hypothetical protein
MRKDFGRVCWPNGFGEFCLVFVSCWVQEEVGVFLRKQIIFEKSRKILKFLLAQGRFFI